MLRSARLTSVRREGLHAHYSLADPQVFRLWQALRDLGQARLAEVDRVVTEYLDRRDDMEAVGAEELSRRLRDGDVTVLDVRAASGVRGGAHRGRPLCPDRRVTGAAAPAAPGRGDRRLLSGAVLRLRRRGGGPAAGEGLPAWRLAEGFPDWELRGLPVRTGNDDSWRLKISHPHQGGAGTWRGLRPFLKKWLRASWPALPQGARAGREGAEHRSAAGPAAGFGRARLRPVLPTHGRPDRVVAVKRRTSDHSQPCRRAACPAQGARRVLFQTPGGVGYRHSRKSRDKSLVARPAAAPELGPDADERSAGSGAPEPITSRTRSSILVATA